MISLLNDDRRTLVEAALKCGTQVAYFNHQGSGSATLFLDAPLVPYRTLIEEALIKQACESVTVYTIGDEWFVTAERGGYLFLGDISQPEKNATILAAAKRLTEPFKLKEFVTSLIGAIDLFAGLTFLAIGCFLLFGPMTDDFISVVDPDRLFSASEVLWPFIILVSFATGLYFLLDLPLTRWRWRRKTTAAIDQLRQPAIY